MQHSLSDGQACARRDYLQPQLHGRDVKFCCVCKQDGSSSTDIGGTWIPLFDGELLCFQPGSDLSGHLTSASRPPSTSVETGSIDKPISRVPSIRVRPDRQGVERKTQPRTSVTRPSMSQRTSLAYQSTRQNALYVSSFRRTSDRLVEVLAHGFAKTSRLLLEMIMGDAL